MNQQEFEKWAREHADNFTVFESSSDGNVTYSVQVTFPLKS